MRLSKKITALFLSVMMLMSVLCITSRADAFTDNFGRLVFEGKDGWLFYSGEGTIENYKGTDLFTAAQLENLKERLEVFRDTLAAQGCEFVIMIVPNKEQLYSQYMPDSYGGLTPYTRAQQLTDYLTSYGFRVVYPINELKEAAETYPQYDIYYRRDTHWNDLGAYIGARSLMAELDIEMPPVEELIVEPFDHDSSDLGRAIGRSLKDTGYSLTGYIYETMDIFESVSENVIHTAKSGVDGRRVLIAGDSFLDSLFPYISQEFDDVTVCFDRTDDIPAMLELIHPDVYIYEVVERYVGDMNTMAALTAPASWVSAAAEEMAQAQEPEAMQEGEEDL